MRTPTTTSTKACPSCGEAAPAGYQYCMRCGAALPAVAQGSAALPAAVASPSAVGPLARARRFSPAMFGAILLCLLLPFITVSCKYGGPDVTFSGVELITGKVVDNGSYQDRVDGLPQAVWILVAAVAGLLTSFLKPAPLSLLPAVAGVAGAAVMVWVRQGLIVAAEIQGAGQFVVSFGVGFQLTLLIFVVAAVFNGVVAVQAITSRPSP